MLLSNSDYLTLIANSLEQDVAPALTADGARAATAMSVNALRELIKREAQLGALHARWIPRGMDLAIALGSLLPRSPEDTALTNRISGLKSLAPVGVDAWYAVVSLIDEGARRLVELRQSLPFAYEAISDWLLAAAEWELGYYRDFRDSPDPVPARPESEPQLLTAEKLAAHLRDRLQDPSAAVIDFRTNPGGFANETFFFTLALDKLPERRLVVRKNAARPFFAFWAHRVREEFEIVRRIADAGLPVPRPLWLFTDLPDVDGDFYVMTHGCGQLLGTLAGANEALSDEVLLNLAAFLAQLHSIPLERFVDYIATGDTPVQLDDDAGQAVARNVEYLYRVWREGERFPSPGEAYAIDWLRRNVPNNPNPPVLVHTDCFVHNFLVEGDVITTVVDWEAAHFGDPAEDLAYIKDQVSEHMGWDRFMEHYHASGGRPVDQEALGYYKTLLNFRNYFGTNVGAARVPQGVLDIRMIPLGSQFFTRFMESCVEGTQT